MPILRVDDTAAGDPLPRVHLGAPARARRGAGRIGGRLRRLRIFALAAALAAAGLAAASAAETPLGTFRYVVVHPTFGDIGTFINTVSRDGDTVVVDTRLRVLVKVLFVTLRRIDADRREVWRRGRLVGYHSITRRDGRTIAVDGHAAGDGFLIDGPYGRVTAPASVRPSNPWSIAILRAHLIMGAETGRLHDVRFSGGAEETVVIGGRAVRTRHYAASGTAQANLWYDGNGVPVKFTLVEGGDLITCTLAGVSPSGMAGRH